MPALCIPPFRQGQSERLAGAGLTRIVTTNTEPISAAQCASLPNLEVIHLGAWMGCVIDAVHRGSSVGGTLQGYYEHCE